MKSRFFLWALCLVLPLASCTPTNTFDENANQEESTTVDEAAAADDANAPVADDADTPVADEADEAVPDDQAEDNAKTEAADADNSIPEVPENGTLKDYKDYISNLNEMMNNKAKDMIAKAQADGLAPNSDEFINSFKGVANQHFDRIVQAADKAMLLKDLSDNEFEELVAAKIQVMMLSSQINEEDDDVVAAKMEAFAAQLRELKKDEIAEEIESQVIQSKILSYAKNGNVKEFAKAAAEVDEKVEKAGKDITPALAQQAMLIILAANEIPGYEAPEGRLENVKNAFSEANDPEVNEMANELEKLLMRAEAEKRFNDALGNEFEFSGTFIDGSEYDPDDYAGKVVLIDFWATWCGPCRAELPNVKKMYKAYHDKGFEVIGVSCDDSSKEDVFKDFLKTNEIPWKQMFDEKAVVPNQQRGGKPIQVSEYYGINGIPCPILIGKDGKVISLNARGNELEKQLVKIYGEAEEPVAEEPVDEDPILEDDVDEAPADEAPADEAPADEAPADEVPADDVK